MTKNPETEPSRVPWLVLVHQLPPKPAYARVKIWRRLQEIGAISLKTSVYVLPAGDEARIKFTELLRDIEQHGGDGLMCEAEVIGGMRDGDIRALFNAARQADYNAIVTELRQLAQAWKKTKKPKSDPGQALARLGQRLMAIGQLDFFGAQGRSSAEALLSQLEHSEIIRADTPLQPKHITQTLIGKTWVTRQDIHVDRIACAWLIRRFIDPRAVLKFVPGRQYAPLPHELRYDMQDGEFTHQGDACSFEVLLTHIGRPDPALKAISEMVHDMDLKDGKFAHPETTGIAHVIAGICRNQGEDEARVARGKELFDDIYAQLQRVRRNKR